MSLSQTELYDLAREEQCTTCYALKGEPCLTVGNTEMKLVHKVRARRALQRQENRASNSLRSQLMTGG